MVEFRFPIRVYIEDTDAGGIIYYVNYLKFMERARTEYLRSLGYGKQAIFNSNLMFVVKSVNVDYMKPASLDDELEVTAKAIKLGGANMVMEQLIFRSDELLCRGEVKIVSVDKATVRPTRIPKAMVDAVREQ